MGHYVARGRLKVKRGDKYIDLKPGDPVPEASTWKNVHAYVNSRRIEWVEDPKPAPKAAPKPEPKPKAKLVAKPAPKPEPKKEPKVEMAATAKPITRKKTTKKLFGRE